MTKLFEIFDRVRKDYERSDAQYTPGGDQKHESRIFLAEKINNFCKDFEDGICRFGGVYRTPVYRESYLFAAEELLKIGISSNFLDELGVVILYCIRHSIELGLKDLIESCHELRKEMSACYLDKSYVNDLSQSDVESLKEHNLIKLRSALHKQLKALNSISINLSRECHEARGEHFSGKEGLKIPERYEELCEELNGYDETGERFRYDHKLSSKHIDESYESAIAKEYGMKIKSIKIPSKDANWPRSRSFDLKGLVEAARECNDMLFPTHGELAERNGLYVYLEDWTQSVIQEYIDTDYRESMEYENNQKQLKGILQALRSGETTQDELLKLADFLGKMWEMEG